jgi:hypothetical protein
MYPVDVGIFILGAKRPRSEADDSPPSSAEVKLYLHSLSLVYEKLN